jgi:hypothetical protein
LLPASRRLEEIRSLIDSKKYFVVHAPRQTGKTTLLRNLSRELTAEGRYSALTVSLESFVQNDVDKAFPQIVRHIEARAEEQLPRDLLPTMSTDQELDPLTALRGFLSQWSAKCPRPLVVFLDEIDALPGEVLISVLRQLRDGYTSRPAPFPQSVALVGLRDVRDYRISVRDETRSLGTSSPFNIKTRSLTLTSFSEGEVLELLHQHTTETGQSFDGEAIHETYSQTRGQPWLVNALAGQLVTDHDALIKDRSQPVTRAHVLEAKEILIERRDTHLDSLVDKLREDRIRRVIEPILIGDVVADATYDDDFSYAKDLGIVTVEDGVRRIANPIYQEIIPRVLTHQVQTSVSDEPAWFIAQDKTLDLEKLIQGFLRFWQRHGDVLLRGMPYQEAAPHLVFMAYLQRIVNSGGQVEREFAVGTGRADLVVTYGGRTDIIELKLKRGRHTLPEGLEQVARYAKRLGREVGYLVIFDPRSETPFEDRGDVEQVEQDGVKIVVVRA